MARRNNDIFAQPKQRRGIGCLVVILLLIVSLSGAGYLLNHAANQRVELLQEKVSVMSLDKAYEGFAILHLSDLHASAIGSDTALWQQLLFGKTFHAVVLSGDMVGRSGNAEPMLSLIHTLQLIKPDVPIYFISGDEDPTPVLSTPHGTADVLADWVRAAQQMGAIYLDAPAAQTVGKRTVWFVPEYLYDVDSAIMAATLTAQLQDMEAAGKQYENEGGAVYRALQYRLDAARRTLSAIEQMNPADLQVAVNHAPLESAYIRSSLEWSSQQKVFHFRSISLLLCGDTCAGQWRLPGVGAVYVPEMGWFPGDEGVRGMQRVNSINQYVSPGLGANGAHPLPGRLMNPPAASIVKFTGALQ